jgi:hypothetical protein
MAYVTRRLAATALTALNDAITREAFARNIDCIDLRIICDEDRDFANPIEPSVHGGAKIAAAILGFAAPRQSAHRASSHASRATSPALRRDASWRRRLSAPRSAWLTPPGSAASRFLGAGNGRIYALHPWAAHAPELKCGA